MLHDHAPPALKFRDLLITTAGGARVGTSPAYAGLTNTGYNGTSVVHFTHYNEDGYQFTVPVQRDFYVHWENGFRLDPEE